jgi:hypothetical protein
VRLLIVRSGLALLAGLNLWWGVWARVAPRHFFDTFPGLGQRWTAAYPPYNEHLVTDLGATFLTLAFLLGVAVASSEPRVRRTVLAGVGLFGALHLLFHATHRGDLSGPSYAGSVVALVVGVLLPVALLALDLFPRRRHHPRDHGAGDIN